MRKLIKEADPDVVEEWKWVKATNPGTPVWSHEGMICTGESYKNVVKLTFAKGASEGSGQALQLGLDGTYGAQSTSTKAKKLTSAAFKSARSPGGCPQQVWQVESFEVRGSHFPDDRCLAIMRAGYVARPGNRLGLPDLQP